LFQAFVIGIIIISALSIGAHTYQLPEPVELALSWMDMGITVFFLVELCIRFIAAPSTRGFFSKGWNLFDLVIVIGSLLPVGGSTVLLARLLRIFRVLRLVSLVPELRGLVNALFKAIPKMSYIALLMFVIFYIYAAMGSVFFAHINEKLWGDVSISMLTLFRVATFEDWTDVMYEAMEFYPLSWIFFITFIFLTAFIFLNMMVGAVLEVMNEEHQALMDEKADKEKGEALKTEALLLNEIKALREEMQELRTTIASGEKPK
jgi:voltage-gated sodium channel